MISDKYFHIFLQELNFIKDNSFRIYDQKLYVFMLIFLTLAIGDLIIFFLTYRRSALMKRVNRTSYEGFRRKNSLNSFDQTNSVHTNELTFIKNKHKEDLELVENMSMELEKLSKRSVGSHSFCDPTTSHHSEYTEEPVDFKFNSKTKHTTSLRNIDQEDDEEVGKKEKVTSLAFFNKFDTIEQSQSLCEQEIDEKPATTRDHPKVAQQILPKRKTFKQPLPNPSRKAPIPQKLDQNKRVHNNMKNDLLQLDKMKKELQNKRYVKDVTSTKPMTSTAPKRREAVQINSKEIKGTNHESYKYMNQSKTDLIKSTKITPKPPVTAVHHPKIFQKNIKKPQKQQEYLQIESNQSKTKEEEPPMPATRMLSDKEKNNLIARLMELREVIQKNEVCSDNLDELTYHMEAIQQLLTR